MLILAFGLAFVSLLPAPPVAPSAKPPQPDYEGVLFPGGLPAEENPITGVRQKPEYQLYDAAQLAESADVAVVFSTGFPASGADGAYQAYLAVLTPERGALHKASLVDITEHCPVSLEFPGNVFEMDARVDSFAIRGDERYVHVNLWCVLSGTGYLSGGSDLFFRVEKDRKAHLVLALDKSDSFSRNGSQAAETKNSDLYLVSLPGKGEVSLVVRTAIRKSPGQKEAGPLETTVYGFNAGGMSPVQGLDVDGKLAGAKALVKSAKRVTLQGAR